VPGLARLARSLGLTPYGLAFHVGSQTMDPRAWDGPIRHCAQIMTALAADGITLAMPDVGGGFPVRYDADPPPLADFSAAIRSAAARLPYPVQLACEPGRAIAASATTNHPPPSSTFSSSIAIGVSLLVREVAQMTCDPVSRL